MSYNRSFTDTLQSSFDQMAETTTEKKLPKPMAKWDRSKGRPEPIRALNKVLEIENQEPLVHISELAPTVRILRPQVIPYLRESVVRMLDGAARTLPEGIHLGVIDAWRPFARQQRIYDFMWKAAREAFPDRPDVALRRTVCRWVAPTDQPAPPGHCTGAAVDVWLVNDANEQLDVCSPYDRHQAAPTYAYGLSDEASYHRTLLVNAMLSQEFSNCRDEWWHYSYGDAGWAVRVGETKCFYGLCHLPEDLYAEQERLSEEFFKDRPNPFLESW